MDKNAIKKFAVWARRDLIERVAQKAAGYGITADEIIPADADSIHGELLSDAVKRQRKALIAEINEKGFEQVIEEVAYTWFNRLIALRFMEVNGYLPSHIRVFTNDDGAFQPQILSEAINLDAADWDGIDMERIYALKQDNKDEELFKYLLILQCNALNAVLPEMFEKIEHYTELLLPDYLLREGSVIEQMIALIPEDDWREQVQIIGWLYQYYNSEKKDAVFAAMSNKVKVSKENIAAATQLFTPDWIVRYMVENSLGRLWVDGHVDTSARAEWKYYLDEAEQTPEVQAQLAEIRAGRKDLTPEQIRFIDPCMGSGHILVYAFDVLMQIYLSCGYTERDAAQNIVRNNLWGLDLDKRAYQLAYFAVMMKARQYDRRFLGRGIKPNLSHFQDLPIVNYSLLDEPIKSFVEQFENADTYGSLITVQADDEIDKALDDFQGTLDLTFGHMEHLMQLYKILSQRYDVVCTNPPYMRSRGMNNILKDFVDSQFSDSRFDLFAAFIERCSKFANSYGYFAMITQHTWMFLSSYEDLRTKIQFNITINMAHLGARAFDEIGGEVVQTTAFVKSKSTIKSYGATYVRLVDEDSETSKRDCFLSGKSRFVSNQEKFAQITGSPIGYWISDSVIGAYAKYPSLGSIAAPRKGNSTSDNNRFLRLWYEVDSDKMNLHCTELKREDTIKKRWYPYNKGGGYRKWYGFNEYLIDWYDDAAEIRKIKTAVIANYQYFMKPGLTWSTLASNDFSIRWFDEGYIFDNGGCCIFELGNKREFLCALLNSKVFHYIFGQLNPTLNFQSGEVAKFPVIYSDSEHIKDLALENVRLSKNEYDSFETSWDFKEHPFIRSVATIKEAYEQWEQECNDRRAKLKANEEELNRIFIEIYGLQDELTPEVDDKDITVRAADLQRDMRSFVSYAVGCMFGRYSLDTEGLAYAGGEWDASKYSSFQPDKDGILPICDDEYFEDDIVARFVEFIKTVYGSDTLEENLKFIAAALGGKGSPREVIRNYFLNGFFADHCKTYQKRPIYWLFDSGKKNGFKCLIYLHRYRPDTIARIRTDYLHEQQGRYRTAIADYEQRSDNAGTAEKVKLTKKLNALKEQAEEARLYEEKIHHLADQMIAIDLDDGVKHNYEIFKDVLAKIK